jgi:hypothetical protein
MGVEQPSIPASRHIAAIALNLNFMVPPYRRFTGEIAQYYQTEVACSSFFRRIASSIDPRGGTNRRRHAWNASVDIADSRSLKSNPRKTKGE